MREKAALRKGRGLFPSAIAVAWGLADDKARVRTSS
ncbi:MAG: hypothetical protein RIQ53_280 [Pseudomonadota bacterium]|jgi:hypothetical protein